MILKMLRAKSSMKQDVHARTVELFSQLREVVQEVAADGRLLRGVQHDQQGGTDRPDADDHPVRDQWPLDAARRGVTLYVPH